MGSLVFLPIYLLGVSWIYQQQYCRGNAVLWWGILAIVTSIVDPVFGAPWVVGTVLSSIHPLLGLIGVSYWMQPDILRQLTVHGFLLPWMWCFIGLIGFPAIIKHQAASRA